MKKKFKTNADKLVEAARTDNPRLCKKFYGTADMQTNAKAFRVAAENRSYRAFERMLEIADEYSDCIVGPFNIATGDDWRMVEKIAKSDMRIKAAIVSYNQSFDERMGINTGTPNGPGPAAPAR